MRPLFHEHCLPLVIAKASQVAIMWRRSTSTPPATLLGTRSASPAGKSMTA